MPNAAFRGVPPEETPFKPRCASPDRRAQGGKPLPPSPITIWQLLPSGGDERPDDSQLAWLREHTIDVRIRAASAFAASA
jgi:hypothetical protein